MGNINAELFLMRQSSAQGRQKAVSERDGQESTDSHRISPDASGGRIKVSSSDAQGPTRGLPTRCVSHRNSIGAILIVSIVSLIALVVVFCGINSDEMPVVAERSAVGELIRATSPKVFAVITGVDAKGMLGSAFAVTRRDLVTNRHVVESVGEGSKIAILNSKWGLTPHEGVYGVEAVR